MVENHPHPPPQHSNCRERRTVIPEPRGGAAAWGATRELGSQGRGPLTDAPRHFIW